MNPNEWILITKVMFSYRIKWNIQMKQFVTNKTYARRDTSFVDGTFCGMRPRQ